MRVQHEGLKSVRDEASFGAALACEEMHDRYEGHGSGNLLWTVSGIQALERQGLRGQLIACVRPHVCNLWPFLTGPEQDLLKAHGVQVHC